MAVNHPYIQFHHCIFRTAPGLMDSPASYCRCLHKEKNFTFMRSIYLFTTFYMVIQPEIDRCKWKCRDVCTYPGLENVTEKG